MRHALWPLDALRYLVISSLSCIMTCQGAKQEKVQRMQLGKQPSSEPKGSGQPKKQCMQRSNRCVLLKQKERKTSSTGAENEAQNWWRTLGNFKSSVCSVGTSVMKRPRKLSSLPQSCLTVKSREVSAPVAASHMKISTPTMPREATHTSSTPACVSAATCTCKKGEPLSLHGTSHFASGLRQNIQEVHLSGYPRLSLILSVATSLR